MFRPRALASGGVIGLAAPAGPIDPERLEAGRRALCERGFEVIFSEDITERRGYLAGDDARRADELMRLVDDPAVGAIVCVRGGYGCQRIVESLDAARIRRAAKPLVGYSDITTLLLWQARVAGLGGIHGPMLERGEGFDAEALDALCESLQGDDRGRVLPGRGNARGVVEGPLCGGSLSLVVASLGTPWEIDTRDGILLIEDVHEAPYKLDRMLQQLRAAGKLEGAALGIGVGALTACDSAEADAPGAEEVVAEVLDPLELPRVEGLRFGHLAANFAWPVGARARLDSDSGALTFLEASTIQETASPPGAASAS